tara:strand:+ start:3517 stop:3639 length:123 start_codon:yes stop_codon:yes gene_type:complete
MKTLGETITQRVGEIPKTGGLLFIGGEFLLPAALIGSVFR